jgi:membrane protease YdiL (CAAX protease family)/DNA-directed RNA polymerase subunit RPC12/RpoP
MALKYKCPNCGYEIISSYLHPGDSLPCPMCRAEILVPDDASVTNETGNIMPSRRQDEAVALESVGSLPESVAPPGPTPWNAFSVLKLILAYIAGLFLFSFIVSLIIQMVMSLFYGNDNSGKPLHKAEFDKIIPYIIAFISTVLPAGLIYLSVVKRHHNRFFEALRLVKMTGKELKRYILIGAGCVAVVIAFFIVITLTGLDKNIPQNMPILEEFRHGYSRLALYTFFALLAPAFEEILFRGYIFQGLKQTWGVMAAAIIVTVAFVSMHAPQLGYSIIMLLVLCVVAVTLIWVRIKTDSLTKCIVIHQIYNTIIVAVTWSMALIIGMDKLSA